MWWDEERWDREMKMLSDLGIKYLIFQTTGAEKWKLKDPSLDEGDWNNFEYDTESQYNNHMVYPSKVFPHLINVGNDSLGTALKLCQKYKIQLFIGSYADDRFFNYGWDEKRFPFFNSWHQHYTENSRKLFEEVWNTYSEYRDQIAGFYFYSEYWNFDKPCQEKYEGAREDWSKIYAQYLHNYDSMISDITQGTKPMLISSFKNFDLSSYNQYGEFLKILLTKANMRPETIFTPQDSMGGWYSKKNGELEEWTRVEKEACKAAGIRFWINNENFRDGAQTAPFEEFKNQIKLTSAADTHVIFAIPHYGSGNSENANDREWYSKLRSFIQESEKEENSNTEEITKNDESTNFEESHYSNEGNSNSIEESGNKEENNNEHKKVSISATVGITVAVVVVVVIGVIAFVFIFKKKVNNEVQLDEPELEVRI